MPPSWLPAYVEIAQIYGVSGALILSGDRRRRPHLGIASGYGVVNVSVGQLTPKTSSELLPAIRYLAQQGVTTTARAIVKGNSIKTDLAGNADKWQWWVPVGSGS